MSTTRFSFFVLLSLGAVLGLCSSVFAAENISPAVISLDEATALALQANPAIAVALSGREVESGQALQAGARPNPTLSAEIEDLRSRYRNSTLLISQQLETAGKRDMRMAAADANLALADADIAIAQAEISAKVYAAFYQVLAAQQAQTLATELLQIASTSKDTSAKRVLAGKVSPVEETKAKVAEASAKIELANANQQLAAAKKRLSGLWGKGLDSNESAFIATGDLENFKPLPTLSDLIAQLSTSPQLKKASLAITQKQAFSNIEKAKQTPDVTLSLGAKRNEELGGITQAIIGLSVPIPIFDKNQGGLQSAKAREIQSQDEKTALENQLATDLADAYSRRQTQIEASTMYKNDILPGAQSAYEAVRKGFEFGKFSFLEVLDAQRTLFQAKTQYIQTLALARLAEADMQSILGAVFNENKSLKELP
jgi:outer membrane protein, heavy metal efflux system